MILEEICSYLSSDSALKAALGADERDSKIYPNYAAITSRVPYLVYRSSNPGGSYDEVLSEEGVTFVITGEDYGQTAAISKALSALLDLNCGAIPSQEHNIYYAKKVGGSDYMDELGRHCRAVNFIFKFR